MADEQPTIRLEIDRDNLTLGALEDLEAATRVTDIIAWFVEHAGADRDQLRALRLGEIETLREQVERALSPN